MRILVAEHSPHALAFFRHARAKGHEIVLLNTKGRVVSRFHSKHLSKVVSADGPDGTMGLISLIRSTYEDEGCDVFVPFGYNMVTAYIESSHEDPSLTMMTPYGTRESYWALSDKASLYVTLEGKGVRLPTLYGEMSPGDTVDLPDDAYPCIVKRSRGVGIAGNIILAEDESDIHGFVDHQDEGESFVIQEYIAGDVFDVGGFAVDGEVYHHVPQRRTVTLPLRGGVAAVNDVFPDEKLIQQAERVVGSVGWSGPFQAEFRQDPSNGEYVLMEVNAKLWGSLPLTLASNDDIVDIMLDWATGGSPRTSLEYTKGLRMRFLVPQELHAMRWGSRSDVIGFLGRFLRRSLYSPDPLDPLPFLALLMQTAIGIVLYGDVIVHPLVDQETHDRLNGA